MNINKAHWVTDGDNVRLSMPIGKVDVKNGEPFLDLPPLTT
jgi:hypothetical protein